MSNTTDIHIAEFNTLRQEIMQDRTFIKDYRSLAFSSTIAVLAFSFSDFASKEPFICLLPILIAIPLSLLCNKCYKSIAKLAAYLYVFYEDFGFEWEKRTGDYAEKVMLPNKKKLLRNFIDTEAPFLSIVIICGIVTLFRCTTMSYKSEVLRFRFFIVVFVVVLSLSLLFFGKTLLDKERKRQIDYWKHVKGNELPKEE